MINKKKGWARLLYKEMINTYISSIKVTFYYILTTERL